MTLKVHAERLGAPQPRDGPDHPRRVLANNMGYVKAHRRHMDYPAYRRKGRPICSGVTESAVKLFNKWVKGTEQFWSLPGDHEHPRRRPRRMAPCAFGTPPPAVS